MKKRLYIGFIFSFLNTMFTAMPIMGAAYGLNLIIKDMKGENRLTVNWAIYMSWVNGYISAFTMVLCLLFYNVQVALLAAAGILLSAVFLNFLGKKSHKNAPVHQKAQDSMIAATIEYIWGMPVVKAFKQDGYQKRESEKPIKRVKTLI